MADTKVSALTEETAPTLDDLAYLVDDPSGTPASRKVSLANLAKATALDPETPPTAIWDEVQEGPGSGYFEVGDAAVIRIVSTVPGFSQFRLTTETAVPVSTTDRTAQGTLFLTNDSGNLLSLCDSKRWRLYESAEIPLVLANVVSGKNYDAFAYLHPTTGAPTYDLGTAWTNDTTRALAISRVNGAIVSTAQFTSIVYGHTVGALLGFWLGTIRASGTNTTEDSAGGVTTQVGGKRFVWNTYNQSMREIFVIDTTDSWTYSTNTWRQTNGNGGNKVEVVVGSVAPIKIFARSHAVGTGVGQLYYSCGVGIDSTTVNSAKSMGQGISTVNSSANIAPYFGYLGIGYHAINWLELSQGAAAGTTTWYGDAGLADLSVQTGLSGEILG